MEYKIRYATINDKNKIVDFLKNIDPSDYILKILDSWLTDEKGKCLIVEDRDNVIAMNHFFIQDGNVAWLEGARVDKEYRNKGIATFLANKTLEILKGMGIKKARLATVISNIPAQRHLAKTKFKEYARWLIWKSKDLKYKEEVNFNYHNSKDIWSYIINSKTYYNSGKLYQNNFIWFDFNYEFFEKAIANFKVIFYKEGLAIFDKGLRFGDFEICYIDINEENYEKILNILITLGKRKGIDIKNFKLISPKDEEIINCLKNYGFDLSNEVLIYQAEI